MPNKNQPNNTDKADRKQADKERAVEEQLRNYGFGGRAELDTKREETEEQEYAANGLPRMDKYSVDKVGRRHDSDAHN